jgi:hypothetical protein
MFKFLKPILSVTLLFYANVYAQQSPLNLQQACVQEQLAEHKGMKDHPVKAEDFKAYCACESAFIAKNADENQLTELKNQPKVKPSWLKDLQQKAVKSCLDTGPKVKT